jgi:mRNA interferase MazF
MTPGDIVLIRFPQADLQAGKLRPALVIATAPGRHPDALLSLISSQLHQVVPGFDEIIAPTDPDYALSGLKVRSVIRLARLASVNTSVINARLGHISPGRLGHIKQRLAEWLLPPAGK